MYGREIKTGLHMLHPDDMNKLKSAEVCTREFEPDDPVWVRNYAGKLKWIAGNYKVKVGEQIQR